MKGYIYKLELLEDTESFKRGELYIGKHNGHKVSYFSRGKLIKLLVQKYGKEIFKRTILAVDIDNDELLSYLEIYYIKLYKCNRSLYSEGFNLTDGGEGISNFKRTEEQIKAISERIKKQYVENRRISPKRKLIYQYSLSTGEQLKTFNTCVEAGLEVGCSNNSIAACARGKSATIKGFAWTYENLSYFKPTFRTKKPVLQYDLENNFIREWDGATDVYKELGYKSAGIASCCKGKTKTSCKFIWKFKIN